MIEPAELPLLIPNNTSAGRGGRAGEGSWFEVMADAWGQALDNQANDIVTRSESLTTGNESPREITLLTAESLRMQFLSNSSHTALTSMGTALETMARKQ